MVFLLLNGKEGFYTSQTTEEIFFHRYFKTIPEQHRLLLILSVNVCKIFYKVETIDS